MENLVELLKLTQEDLKIYLYNILKNYNMNPSFKDGYIYAEGNIPVLVVAHMDTVFENEIKNIFYSQSKDIIFNFEGGLGGDDRCGIYAILELLKEFKPYVLFTEDEEIGCIGARKAAINILKPEVKYIIEFDRRGKDDCVFYDCGNKEFINYIQRYGFKESFGTFSDICILGKGWNIASVNLSSGYYNEHTKMELIIFSHLQSTIERSKLLLKDIKFAPNFDYQDKMAQTSNHGLPFYKGRHPFNPFYFPDTDEPFKTKK